MKHFPNIIRHNFYKNEINKITIYIQLKKEKCIFNSLNKTLSFYIKYNQILGYYLVFCLFGK